MFIPISYDVSIIFLSPLYEYNQELLAAMKQTIDWNDTLFECSSKTPTKSSILATSFRLQVKSLQLRTTIPYELFCLFNIGLYMYIFNNLYNIFANLYDNIFTFFLKFAILYWQVV